MQQEHQQPIRPLRLRPGDTIGIVAPASPFDRKAFGSGIAVLESMGFQVSVPEDLAAHEGYLAGSDAHRGEMVNRLFADPAIDAILCARGGFGSMRMLSHLDFESIREHPKILVGFSDVTALLSAVYERCGLVTYHGPVVATLGEASRETQASFYHTVTADENLVISADEATTLRPGSATGPVSGGNLATLCHLVGTPYQPSFYGHILMLEETGEKPYRIDRMLTQMRLAGCLDGVAGLVLGAFDECGDGEGIFGILEAIFKEGAVPMLAGLDFGHGRHNLTIPLGLAATLDADAQTLSYLEPSTRLPEIVA
ncbi:MAG: LD-carboxypeptidase [Desulfobacterales bacterium]